MENDFLLRVVGLAILIIVIVFGIAVIADALESNFEVAAGFYILMSTIAGGLSAVLVARFRVVSNGNGVRKNGNAE